MNAVATLTAFALIAVSMAVALPAGQMIVEEPAGQVIVEEPAGQMIVEEPANDVETQDYAPLPVFEPLRVITERADRHSRATCDLLSISLPFGSLNHSACAAHCIAKRKGYRGGRCKDGVCHCRK